MRPFRVAFVCTGNRFRSPLADALFRRATAGLPVETHSFGTLELGRVPPLPEALEEGARLGLDLVAHGARSLALADLSAEDLVVGFERMHLVTTVVEAGARRDHTFTLPELVGLLENDEEPGDGDPIARARRVVARAHEARPVDDPALFAVPELADPLGQGPAFFRETADRLDALVTRLARGLFG
jgi:protein-tyrosine phosphatase